MPTDTPSDSPSARGSSNYKVITVLRMEANDIQTRMKQDKHSQGHSGGRKTNFIKQKSDGYKSSLSLYSKMLVLLAVEMLAFLVMARAPHGLHPGEVRARGR
jgi:hypothetical protein